MAGYAYGAYTVLQAVLTDGYYYAAYDSANGSMVSGYTVSGIWEDLGDGYYDDNDNWVSTLTDVAVTPYFVAASSPDSSWADFAPDQQFQPDGTYTHYDARWAPGGLDSSWGGDVTAQQGYVDVQQSFDAGWQDGGSPNPDWGSNYTAGTRFVPDGTFTHHEGGWQAGPLDTSWGGGAIEDPQMIDDGPVQVSGGWKPGAQDTSWPGGSTEDAHWIEPGIIYYDGFWQDGPQDTSWLGGSFEQWEWKDGGAPQDVPFISYGTTVDPSWISYDPIYQDAWVDGHWSQGGSLTFAPGQTSETIDVQTIDQPGGGGKYFYVGLTGATGATLGSPSSGIATILDSSVADSGGGDTGGGGTTDDGSGNNTDGSGDGTNGDGSGDDNNDNNNNNSDGGYGPLVATAETASGDQDSPITGNVASGVSGGTPGYTFSGGGGSYGSATVDSDGSFTYTPNAGYFGQDSFVYNVTDGTNSSTNNVVTVTINQVVSNSGGGDGGGGTTDNLTAAPDSNSGIQDSPMTGNLAGDVNGGIGQLTFSAGGAGNGTVTVGSDGWYTYTPNPGYWGSDSFSYSVSDSGGGSASNTVSLTINSTNNNSNNTADTGPSASDLTASGNQGNPITGSLAAGANGGVGQLSFSASNGSNGSVSLDWAGNFTYTPNSVAVTGSDSFTYTATDSQGQSASATVHVDVAATPPSAGDINLACAQNGSTTASATVGVSGGAGAIGFQMVSGSTANGGQASIDASGNFTYTAPAGFTGTDTFGYTAVDAAGQTASANFVVDVS